MTATTTQRVWVTNVYEEAEQTHEQLSTMVARRAMDQLLVASQATFQMHAGDLFFDYHWLAEHWDDQDDGPIWWGHDPCHTAIGHDRDLIAGHCSGGLYQVAIPPAVRGRLDIIITKEE